MIKIILFTIITIFFSATCFGQDNTFDESVLSKEGKTAYQTLLKIKPFALGGVGYSGKMSDGEKAFDILYQEKEAISAFRSLIKTATIEGGLYGLFGLEMTDCDCYEQEFTEFKKIRTSPTNSETITFQSGCMVSTANTNKDKVFLIEKLELEKYLRESAAWKKSLLKQHNQLRKTN